MPYNMPTITENHLSFGPGVIYIGAAGATPATQVGAVDPGMTLSFKRTMMDLYQGSPKSLVLRVCTQEDLEIEFTGLELNLTNLKNAIGAGTISTVGSTTTLEGGGDMTFNDLALRFVHQTPAGGTIIVDMWRVNGSGEAAMQFGEEWVKFPLKFAAQQTDTDWASATLAANKKMYKITQIDPPA